MKLVSIISLYRIQRDAMLKCLRVEFAHTNSALFSSPKVIQFIRFLNYHVKVKINLRVNS